MADMLKAVLTCAMALSCGCAYATEVTTFSVPDAAGVWRISAGRPGGGACDVMLTSIHLQSEKAYAARPSPQCRVDGVREIRTWHVSNEYLYIGIGPKGQKPRYVSFDVVIPKKPGRYVFRSAGMVMTKM
jgi:hypothetical protein